VSKVLVILNSDILFATELLTSLTPPVRRLADACREQGHVLIIPETTLLEFNLKQSELVGKAKGELDTAYATLTRFGVSYEQRPSEEVIALPDLINLLTTTGATVRLEEPTIEDFQEAHRRACLHLAPHPQGNTKSDEMRDLVIWMTAIRLARENNGALLLSYDKVHVHDRGDAEANEAGLIRANAFDDALELLDVHTPAGQLFRRLMDPAWPLLADEGLPLATDPIVRSVARPVFEQGDRGLASATCILKVATTNGKTLQARAEIKILEDHQQVTLRNIMVESGHYSDPVTVRTDLVIDEVTNVEEQLFQLRTMLEGRT
jgi:hypothetical protein